MVRWMAEQRLLQFANRDKGMMTQTRSLFNKRSEGIISMKIINNFANHFSLSHLVSLFSRRLIVQFRRVWSVFVHEKT